ncbi:MAG: SsrA-binding protein SmpB, partial [Myxococcota bacterium]|nr:SsrA-binding protein SmpB [Myxococcota bacterium]
MPSPDPARRRICRNRKARFEYEILETIEAGIALLGSEVKSLRNNRMSLEECYVRFEDGEAWLVEAHIAPYVQANRNNHDPRRPRRLLLHRREIRTWSRKVQEKGLSVVPLEVYFSGPRVKVELGLG